MSCRKTKRTRITAFKQRPSCATAARSDAISNVLACRQQRDVTRNTGHAQTVAGIRAHRLADAPEMAVVTLLSASLASSADLFSFTTPFGSRHSASKQLSFSECPHSCSLSSSILVVKNENRHKVTHWVLVSFCWFKLDALASEQG